MQRQDAELARLSTNSKVVSFLLLWLGSAGETTAASDLATVHMPNNLLAATYSHSLLYVLLHTV